MAKEQADKIGIRKGREMLVEMAGHRDTEVMVALETICVLVCAYMVKPGGDKLIVDTLAEGVKERLKRYRMKGAH